MKIALAALGCIPLLSVTALAEPPAPHAPRSAPRVIDLEEMVIEGRIMKPQVFYVLGRSRIEYQNLKLHRDFTDKIVSAAKKNPF